MAAQIEAANPGLRTEIRVIKTQGDLVQDKPLQEFGTKGVFVQEIEQALLSGEIDLAVHSLKDMPAEQPEGLEMVITPRREDPRDVIITFGGQPYRQLADMPAGSVIATVCGVFVSCKGLMPGCKLSQSAVMWKPGCAKARSRAGRALFWRRLA